MLRVEGLALQGSWYRFGMAPSQSWVFNGLDSDVCSDLFQVRPVSAEELVLYYLSWEFLRKIVP